jgi:hypothetical protein
MNPHMRIKFVGFVRSATGNIMMVFTEYSWVVGDIDFRILLKGTLAELVGSYIDGQCILGVVIDRMEECPEEVATGYLSFPILPHVIHYLRTEYAATTTVLPVERSSTN